MERLTLHPVRETIGLQMCVKWELGHSRNVTILTYSLLHISFEARWSQYCIRMGMVRAWPGHGKSMAGMCQGHVVTLLLYCHDMAIAWITVLL
jgi:hypothetical protein